MNWRWILMLAALGVAVNAAAVYGLLPASIWLSVGLVLIVAVLLGYNVRQKLFLNGFVTAILWTVVASVLMYFNWDTYVANNPKLQEGLAKVPEGTDIRPWVLVSSIIGGAVWGAALGLLALVAGKLLQEKTEPAPVAPVETEKQDVTGQ